MPRNGAGIMSYPAGTAAVSGDPISSTAYNAFLADLLSAALNEARPIAVGGTGQTTANAGFNALAPTTTRGDLIRRGASLNERVALGASGSVLGSDGTDAIWRAAADAFADIKQAATTLATGVVELATDAETQALADTERAVTPSNLGALNAGDAQEGLIEIAIQSEMEAGTDTGRAVTPGRQHFHPSAPKVWASVSVSAGTPTLAAGYNVDSITDTAEGLLTVTFDVDFASVAYAILATIERAGTTASAAAAYHVAVRSGTIAVGSVVLECWAADAFTLRDPNTWSILCMGDQA